MPFVNANFSGTQYHRDFANLVCETCGRPFYAHADRTGVGQNLGKQGTVIRIRDDDGHLLIVRFSTHSTMEAFDHRFSFSDGMNKTAVERKIASMYTRQPYYKTIKGNKSCVA